MPEADPDDLLKMGLAEPQQGGTWSKIQTYLVIKESNSFRKVWNLVVTFLLVYTGTVFPAKLAFYDFAIPEEGPRIDAWEVLHTINDILFGIDLFLCFFLTFRDHRGKEVTDLCMIAKRYLRTYFVVNFVACIPPDVVGEIYLAFYGTTVDDSANGMHQTVRITRLQRISRLARLVRLARLTKLAYCIKSNQMLKSLSTLRSARVFNFLAGLLWVCHLTACGWYFVAALEYPVESSWIYVRYGNLGIEMEFDPFTHWLNAMYWVLTVFTTVGFGDISPMTNPEIVYGMFTMLVGCIANGIILSEVINVITEADQFAREITRQKQLVSGFSQHVKLRNRATQDLVDWVSDAKALKISYDRGQMKDMILSSSLPTRLTTKLPEAIFHGHLVKNRFITCACMNQLHVPSRFVMLIALAVNERIFDGGETVYHAYAHVWNIFLVLDGVFANVAKPTSVGGISETPDLLSAAGKTAFGNTPTQKLPSGRSAEQPQTPTVAQNLWTTITYQNQPAKTSKTSSQDETQGFTPYQLFCFGNYFGDVELLYKKKGSRRTCVRCESPKGGILLVLGKDALDELTAGFPMSYSAWRVVAAQRDMKRKQLIAKFKRSSGDYQTLAANIIQWYARERLSRRGIGPGNRGVKEWGLDPGQETRLGHSKSPNLKVVAAPNKGTSNNKQRVLADASTVQQEVDVVNERIDALQREMTGVHTKLDLIMQHLMPKGALSL